MGVAFEYYINAGGRRLRCGFTTGTCAALAAQAALRFLLTGTWPETVSVMTPKGLKVTAPVEEPTSDGKKASCGIRKDGGDDVDKTTGALIVATAVLKKEKGIDIDGGYGVGRVTKPGLDQPVGNAAINSVPRRMIKEAAEDVFRKTDYHGGASIIISVPEGETIAGKTFNPNLGIVNGISILGTSGIVEPMSTQALIDTIRVEIRQASKLGDGSLILTPGNYGLDFLRAHPGYPRKTPIVRCSNFIGAALDECALENIREVLLVGHVGKLVKLAGGIMNTHSHEADCRAELFTAHAALCGADGETVKALMSSVSTDACLAILDEKNLKSRVMASLLQAVEKHLLKRADGRYHIGALLFSNVYGELGRTKGAEEIIGKWQKKEEGFMPSAQESETRSL